MIIVRDNHSVFKMILRTLVTFCLVALAHSDPLKCLDCDPSSAGNCISPTKQNEKVTACAQNAAGDLQLECFSVYFKSSGAEKSGVYRGCIEKEKNSTETSCDYLKSRLPAGEITRCKTCASNECNTHDVANPDPLKCYDCEPTAAGGCADPKSNNVKITSCEDTDSTSGVKKEINDIDKLDIEPRINDQEESQFECFSLYYEAGGEKSGVYRGCIKINRDVQTSCDLLKDRLSDGNVTTCTSCAVAECNTEYVGGASSLITSLGIIVFNLACIYLIVN